MSKSIEDSGTRFLTFGDRSYQRGMTLDWEQPCAIGIELKYQYGLTDTGIEIYV